MIKRESDDELDEDPESEDSDDESEEELENIIERSPDFSLNFRQHALDEIVPTLHERSTGSQQPIRRMRFVEQEEEEEDKGVYDNQRQAREYHSQVSQQGKGGSSASYNASPSQSPDDNQMMSFSSQQRSRGQRQMGSAWGGSGQQEQGPGFEQRNYETDMEKKMKEDRKRMF